MLRIIKIEDQNAVKVDCSDSLGAGRASMKVINELPMKNYLEDFLDHRVSVNEVAPSPKKCLGGPP